MVVAFDAVGPSSVGASAAANTALSWSHTNAGNLLIVGVSVGQNPDTATTTCAYAGVSMATVGKVHVGNLTAGYVQMFSLFSPAAGANTVAVSSTANADLIGGSVSFTGAGSLGTPVTANPNAVTSASVTVATTTTTGMVVDAFAWGVGAAATSTQTQRWQKVLNASTAAGDGAASTAASTGGNVTMGYSWTGSDAGGLIAVEVLPVTATSYTQAPADAAYTGDRLSVLPPDGLSATVASTTEIDLTWFRLAGAVSYDLERNGVVIATGLTGLSYSDTGLTPGTTYTYNIRSVY